MNFTEFLNVEVLNSQSLPMALTEILTITLTPNTKL